MKTISLVIDRCRSDEPKAFANSGDAEHYARQANVDAGQKWLAPEEMRFQVLTVEIR